MTVIVGPWKGFPAVDQPFSRIIENMKPPRGMFLINKAAFRKAVEEGMKLHAPKRST